VHFDKLKAKPFELLRAMTEVADVSTASDDEQEQATSAMLAVLARMARDQVFLSITGLPLLIYMILLAFIPDSAVPLLWAPGDF